MASLFVKTGAGKRFQLLDFGLNYKQTDSFRVCESSLKDVYLVPLSGILIFLQSTLRQPFVSHCVLVFLCIMLFSFQRKHRVTILYHFSTTFFFFFCETAVLGQRGSEISCRGLPVWKGAYLSAW